VQDALQAVKDLYASAAYEDGLSAVGKLDATARNIEAEPYRVFCLVALGRLDEAGQAVELCWRLVQSIDPTQPRLRPAFRPFSPRSGDASDRVS